MIDRAADPYLKVETTVTILVTLTVVMTRLVKRSPSLPAIIGTSAKYRQSVSEIFKRTFSEQEGCTERQFAHHIFLLLSIILFFPPLTKLASMGHIIESFFFLPFFMYTHMFVYRTKKIGFEIHYKPYLYTARVEGRQMLVFQILKQCFITVQSGIEAACNP